MRNVQIEVTIGLLERVGIRPYGSYVSGCRIVAEALEQELSEEHVKRILEKAFTAAVRKYSEAIAKRTGLGQIPR